LTYKHNHKACGRIRDHRGGSNSKESLVIYIDASRDAIPVQELNWDPNLMMTYSYWVTIISLSWEVPNPRR
jgi:hypothetical protein